jgi:hypothetical protein
VTPVDEVIRSFDDLVTQGKVRHIGLSDVPAWYASRAQALAEFRGYEPVCALQMEYSLVERNLESEFTRLATDYGMGIMAWSPLASGLLSGKYRPGENASTMADGRLKATAGRSNPIFDRFTDKNWSIVQSSKSWRRKSAGRYRKWPSTGLRIARASHRHSRHQLPQLPRYGPERATGGAVRGSMGAPLSRFRTHFSPPSCTGERIATSPWLLRRCDCS